MKLEVKVNDGGFLIDAAIEVKDGVMIVTPKAPLSKKEEKWTPKAGDIVTSVFQGIVQGTGIFDYEEQSEAWIHVCVNLNNELCTDGYLGDVDYLRPATEEEKKLLFDRLYEEGLTWDAEKMKLLKKKWLPKDGEKFFFPSFIGCRFKGRCVMKNGNINVKEWSEYTKGWIFRTAEESQDLCNKLNAAIASVTP